MDTQDDSTKSQEVLLLCKTCPPEIALKPASQFSVHKGTRRGYRYRCKACLTAYNYARRHKDLAAAQQRNREDTARRRRDQPEHMKAIKLASYQRHRRRILDKRNAEKRANRPKARRQARESYHRNLATSRAASRRKAEARRARLLGLPYDLTEAQWELIQAKQGYRCAYCGKKKPLHQDHILSVTQGGGTTAMNIIGACKSCNSKKRDRGILCPVQPILPLAL